MPNSIPTAGLVKALGLPEDADEDTILDAVDSRPITTEAAVEALAAAHGIPADQVETRLKAQAPSVPANMTLVPTAQWEDVKVAAAAGAAAARTLAAQDRDEVVQQAFHDGKISAAAMPTYKRQWDLDPEATRAELEKADVVFPISAAAGHGGTETDDEADANYRRLFPDEKAS